MEHVTLLMVFGLALLVAGAMMWLPTLLAPRRTSAAKVEPFECGKDPLALPEGRFAIKFSTVAIFFIIFDIEVMLIFPWAVQVRALGWTGYLAMLVFLGVLMLGFLYMWKKGGLEWD
ncbi:MAG: NADH-quinone oxidoreductase subunit A [Candidatus Rokubacteria bacterium]|nr:NADH-quinone oxidoreductase subunit A [Candidatus Rokubacteria bacterium]